MNQTNEEMLMQLEKRFDEKIKRQFKLSKIMWFSAFLFALIPFGLTLYHFPATGIVDFLPLIYIIGFCYVIGFHLYFKDQKAIKETAESVKPIFNNLVSKMDEVYSRMNEEIVEDKVEESKDEQ